MDFFASQDSARTRTRWLVFLYGVAVVALIGITHFAGTSILSYMTTPHMRASEGSVFWHYFYRLDLLIAFTSLTATVIFVGTVVKMYALRQGGAAVAGELGGRELSRQTSDALEMRLLNIVEEMSIASGTPIPRVFLLNNEAGINAFAAGHTLEDAAIGVTRGALEKLSRDQLQGVIAHEFSHILNADMRLNIRLIGILNGILGLFVLGRTIFRILTEFRPRRQSSSRKSSSAAESASVGLLLAALSLMVIGSVGALFARMIQSAVSRQREFLADSSAVQFTRNPDGLAGALTAIGAISKGSLVKHPRATEVGHLFFSEGLQGFLAGVFATHPPLAERVRRLTGQIPEQLNSLSTTEHPVSEHSVGLSALSPEQSISAGQMVESIGGLAPEQINMAQQLLKDLPEIVIVATRDPQGAQAVVAALLLSSEKLSREKQISLISSSDCPLTSEIIVQMAQPIDLLSAEQKLPILDLAICTLRKMSPRQYTPFHRLLSDLVDADSCFTLFEYAVITILRHSVEPLVFSIAPSRTLISNKTDLSESLAIVLSALANAGCASPTDAEQLFFDQTRSISGWSRLPYRPPEKLTFEVMDGALDRLSRASPSLQREILQACCQLVVRDRKVDLPEIELLRAFSAAMGCPMPLLQA